jgi:hypothetical protein
MAFVGLYDPPAVMELRVKLPIRECFTIPLIGVLYITYRNTCPVRSIDKQLIIFKKLVSLINGRGFLEKTLLHQSPAAF